MNYTIQSIYNQEDLLWHVQVTGEIDIFNSPEFKEYLMNIFNEKKAGIKIDCSELDYIDSTALGVLVSVLKRVKEYGFDIYLTSMKPNLVKLFKITNLEKVFIIEGESNGR